MSRAKRIINSIFTENTLRLTEEINKELMERAGNLVNNKRMEVIAEMFDDSEFSTKSIRNDIYNHKTNTRHNVIEALKEEYEKE
jgi:hypothetical protein